MLSQSGQAAEADVLTPIEQPPNHDGLDLSQLPPMREATLSVEQVNSLFDDIEKLTTDVLLMQRANGAQRASTVKLDTASQLALAKAALLSGKMQNVQVRYRWQNSLWIDTLTAQTTGYRLVRIAHPGHRNV